MLVMCEIECEASHVILEFGSSGACTFEGLHLERTIKLVSSLVPVWSAPF